MAPSDGSTGTAGQQGQVYVACVPHVPFLETQDRALSPEFWESYEARVKEFNAFDPELVIVFGADHYDGLHLKLMPAFTVIQRAEAMDDVGGFPGHLDIPPEIAFACAKALVRDEFDIATSYAMTVDHGFSNVLHNFMGAVDARPVLPIHINAMCDPKPSFRRCRLLGEAVGRFARTLGKRVAFLGSGGLSHETGMVFPQYDSAPDQRTRDFIVHGGERGEITMDGWLTFIRDVMLQLSPPMASGDFVNEKLNPVWDHQFLTAVTAADLSGLDSWTDEEVEAAGGNGAGEIRQWIAAIAAARAAGADVPVLDYYGHHTPIGVGAAVVHAWAGGKAA